MKRFLLELSQVTAYFARHLVGLGWYEGRVDAAGQFVGQPQFCCGSGFLFRLDGETYLVTAGHVVLDSRKRVARGVVAKDHHLFDAWSPAATILDPTPFNFDAETITAEYSPDDGIDVAFVRLPNFLAEGLLQTITPFSIAELTNRPAHEFDFFAVVGSPVSERLEALETSGPVHSQTIALTPRVVYVEHCPNPPETAQAATISQFIGSIAPGEQIADISGMSGAPIIAFRQTDEEVKYWPIAIQSRWLDRSRIVIGTSLLPMIGGFRQWMVENPRSATSS